FQEIKIHDHVPVIDEKVEPTCTKTGLTQGSHCSECNEVIVPRTVIGALGHIEVTEAGKTATCEEDGFTEKIYCAVCGEVIQEHERIPALQHHLVVTKEAKPATLTSDGNTEEKTCDRCNKTEGGDVIYKIDIVALENNVYIFEGKAITPAVVVRDSTGQTIDSKFYTVTYNNNNAVGTAKAVVTFRGDYTGTKELSFTIKATEKPAAEKPIVEEKLAKAVLSAVKNSKGKIAVISWKKVVNAKGYEVQYTLDKKFKKGIKTQKATKTTLKIKKLKKGKTYYVRVRAWKMGASGKKIYGDWSKIKKVTIKK
ncbi:MAG: hypothetical protein K6G65_06875, partial [Lachnospiraceae bacterium]|nr:hypothetical protein [Lachnospiraceae bacterium]